MADTLTRLQSLIQQRKNGDVKSSYVAELLGKGRGKIVEKYGEEAVELIVAALTEKDQAVVSEAADALFHMLILLTERDIPLEAVLEELEKREGISGLAEKASRKS